MVLVLILLTGGFGCGGSTDKDDDIAPFRFVVLSDIHVRIPGNPDDDIYNNQGNLDNFRQAVNIIHTQYESADFVAVTGDLVGCLFSEDPDAYLNGNVNPAEVFMEIMEGFEKPCYVALGNHDYQKGFDAGLGEGISTDDINLMEAIWDKVLGIAPYYAFIHKGVQFIFLNSNRGPLRDRICPGDLIERFCTGSFDPDQLRWLETCLEKKEPAILFCHHPPWTDSESKVWAFYGSYRIDPEDFFYDVVRRYKDNVLAIFVGHGHFWQSDTLYGTIPVHETAALGDMLGEADHISVVDIDPVTRQVTVRRHG
jgi:3',5'-cyclic AMP phosphodiesterase CpdA